MRRGTLVVMVKEPRAGRVKTRLGQGIGMTAAAMWYRHQLRHLLRTVGDPRWETVLSVSPDRARDSRAFPVNTQRMPQGGGDLGRRMMHGLRAFDGPVVLIGSDIPAVSRAHVQRAFRALGAHASVVGPSTDGGFWLVGLAHPSRSSVRLFEGIAWSAPTTLADTLPRLPGPTAQIAMLSDVDEVTDFRAKARDANSGAW